MVPASRPRPSRRKTLATRPLLTPAQIRQKVDRLGEREDTLEGLRKGMDAVRARMDSALHERKIIEAEIAYMDEWMEDAKARLAEMSDSDPEVSQITDALLEKAQATVNKGKGKQ